MSDKIKILYYALWIAHPVLQMGIAAMMVHRGLHRKFKFFFGYIVTQLIIFAVLFPTSGIAIPPLFTSPGSATP